jgi:2-polyprenyl-6-methoxyphenol hydroxylase-like FAD-dependent oxidoreductase
MDSPRIVGGGIGGLTAAIALRRHGVDPVVHERAAALRPVGAGILLGTNALQAYDRLGLAGRIRDAGSEKTAVRILDPDGSTVSSLDVAALEAEFGHPFVAIHRGDLQRLLLEQLPVETVRTGEECVDVTEAAEGAKLSFADGSTATADLVVGADGIGSAVRRALFPDASVRPSGIVCYRGVAPVELAPTHGDTGVEVWGEGHFVGYEALGDGRVYWYVTATRPLADPDVPAALGRALAAAVGTYPDPLPDLVAATPDEEILVDELADVGPLETWSRGSAVLLGDAAHAPLPFLGQGAGQAVEDALVLARRVAGHDDPRAAFAAYEAARKEKAEAVVAASRRLGRAASLDGRVACALRNAAMRAAPARLLRRQQRKIATLSG